MRRALPIVAACLMLSCLGAPLFAATQLPTSSSSSVAKPPAPDGLAPAPVFRTGGFVPTGICTDYCSGPDGFTTVNWESTPSLCCDGTTSYCPEGTFTTEESFLPYGGSPAFLCQNF
jgi:hypothetical protein